MVSDPRRDRSLLPFRPYGAVVIGVAIVLAALVLALPANHDVGWYLFMGRRVVDGARPYVDFVEVNAPFIIALEAGVVALARLLHVEALALHQVLTVLLCLASAWSVLRLLRDRLEPARLALFGVALLAVLMAYPGYDTGQREHLALALLVPYLTALGLGGGVPAGLAVAAALGVALKPYFLLIPLAAEVAMWRKPGRHVLVFGGALAVVAAGSVLFAPDYVATALHYAPAYLPFARIGRLRLALMPRTLLTAGAAALAAAWARRLARDGHEATPGLARAYAGGAAGGLVSLLLQARIYTYLPLPAEGLAILALAAALILRPARPGRLALPLAAFASVALGVMGVQRGSFRIRGEFYQDRPALEAALRPYGPGARLLGLTWALRTSFPIVNQLHLRWTGPYNSLWVINSGRGPGRHGLAREAADRIVEDATRHPPDVILLDTTRSTFPPHIEAWSYLSSDPRFERLMTGYREAASVGHFLILAPVTPR